MMRSHYCVSEALRRNRLGAACDFRVVRLKSNDLVEWILEQLSPFDSLDYYEGDSRSETLRERPIHIS